MCSQFTLVLLCGFLLGAQSLYAHPGTSAIRGKNESWLDARARNSSRSILQNQDRRTPEDMSASLNKMDFSAALDVGTEAELAKIFNYVRDTKFLEGLTTPLTTRRLTWLYPDDGCYARAELAAYYAETALHMKTLKLFAFGDLAVKTDNIPGGYARWWYHVVPVVRLENQVWVLDPAIEPHRPMKVEDWKKALSEDDEIDRFALCETHTYDTDDGCVTPRARVIDNVLREQKTFLGMEFRRIQELGRDPVSELGDSPPWN